MITQHPRILQAINDLIQEYMYKNWDNQSKTAKELNISRTSLRRYLKLTKPYDTKNCNQCNQCGVIWSSISDISHECLD